MLRLQKLTKQYKTGDLALKNIDLEVPNEGIKPAGVRIAPPTKLATVCGVRSSSSRTTNVPCVVWKRA